TYLFEILLMQDGTTNFIVAYWLKKQFYACMKRMTKNPDLITKMDVQLEDFKTQKEFFDSKVAQNLISTKTTVDTKRKNGLKAKIMND
ncbi:hypothetical protein S83_060093, partial [Arachis hypogaea]